MTTTTLNTADLTGAALDCHRAQCENLCQRLQLAAMRCESHIIMVDYAGHVDTLTVCVYPAGVDFMAPIEEWPARLMYRYARLGSDEAYRDLLSIVDELGSMGVVV